MATKEELEQKKAALEAELATKKLQKEIEAKEVELKEMEKSTVEVKDTPHGLVRDMKDSATQKDLEKFEKQWDAKIKLDIEESVRRGQVKEAHRQINFFDSVKKSFGK